MDTFILIYLVVFAVVMWSLAGYVVFPLYVGVIEDSYTKEEHTVTFNDVAVVLACGPIVWWVVGKFLWDEKRAAKP